MVGFDQSELAQRVLECFLKTQRRLGRSLTLGEYGALVAEREGRDKPYVSSTAQRWMVPGPDGSIPSLPTLAVIADLAGEDLCYVITGRAAA